MKRKVIATMLAATLALSLAGCGGSSGSSGSSDSSSSSEAAQLTKTNHCAGLTVSHPTAQPENWIRRH